MGLGCSGAIATVSDTKQLLIYVVEASRESGDELSTALAKEDFAVRYFRELSSFASACCQDACPDAVVMDLDFPQQVESAAEMLQQLKQQREECPPILFITDCADVQAKLAALRAGASRCLARPLDVHHLVFVLNTLVDRQLHQSYRVLLVEGDSDQLQKHEKFLKSAQLNVLSFTDPLEAYNKVESFRPHVVVLDMALPQITGPELAALLREREPLLNMCIVFLASEVDVSQQLMALDLGGEDFLIKPVDEEHFVAAVMARAQRSRQLSMIRQRLEATLYERERELLALNHHALVSVTDHRGTILSANKKFSEISGYCIHELIGENHRLLKSGLHSKEFFKELWRTIASGQVWKGEICNRAKDGRLYWVESTITPFLDAQGKPYQYISIRTDITQIKHHHQALQTIVESTAPLTGQAYFDAVVQGMVVSSEMEMALISRYESSQEKPFNTLAFCEKGELKDNFSYDPADTPCERLKFSEVVCYEEQVQFRFPSSEWLSEHGVESYLGTALRDSRGQLLGHVMLMDSRRLDDLENRTALLLLFASHIASEMERRDAELLVEQNKERLRRGQLYANIGTWDWNIVTGALFWTERIAPLFGYPEGDLETTFDNFISAVYPEDRAKVTEALNACIERDVPYEIEHRVVWPDGTIRWLLEKGAVKRDIEGNPVQMLGVVQDIDYRKRTELALEAREHQLQEAQSLAHLGDWNLNFESGEMYWSDEVFRILGYQPHQFKPTLDSFISCLHPDDREKMEQARRQAGESGAMDLVHRILRPDGSIRHVHQLSRTCISDNGKLVSISGTMQDITERVETEEQLIRAREKAERASNAKSEFLSSMSHELRTPMNAILGFGQLLEADAVLNSDHKDSVNEILKAGKHLLALINEILDLAKIESGQLDVSLESVELSSVIKESVHLIERQAAKRSIRVNCYAIDGAVVLADRVRLKQVILNLLSNAVKYNRRNGNVTVEVEASSDELVRVTVTDNGQGIPPEQQDEIFQPFNRLGLENSNIEGTGIGLTITQRFVEMMGGTIGMESELGMGSCFWIELPVDAMVHNAKSRYPIPSNRHTYQQIKPNSSQTFEPQDEARNVRSTILYIEDNPANLKLVAQALENSNNQIELLCAYTPEVGIQMARDRRPDLILLDINLPNIDGYQVMDEFNKDPHCEQIPVIAITANAMPLDIEKGKQAGFVHYLTKPLDILYLLKVVNDCLNKGADEAEASS